MGRGWICSRPGAAVADGRGGASWRAIVTRRENKKMQKGAFLGAKKRDERNVDANTEHGIGQNKIIAVIFRVNSVRARYLVRVAPMRHVYEDMVHLYDVDICAYHTAV